MLNIRPDTAPHVLERLEQDQVIWLTTVAANGTPQPNPVWFYWNQEEILIYTPPASLKLKNIARNPRVSVNFEGATATGGDVVVITGTAILETDPPMPDPGYVKKYLRVAEEDFKRTVEDLFEEYHVLIRIKPEKVRVF